MRLFKKLSVWQKAAIALIITGIIASGSYYVFLPEQPYSDVKKFEQKHTKRILEIFNSHLYWLVADPAYPIEFALKYQTSEQDFAHIGNMPVRVLEKDGNVVAFITYYMKKPSVGRILFLAVDEKVRGKRYGEYLVKYAIQELIKMGAKQSWLVTRINNYSAQALYKRIGFVEKNRKHGFIKYVYTP